ncbi:hypothetical protein [Litorisediminicola beolgyonensis]|uniref:Uncharacterized protein n=1 Tax=Litorisediminicola beolgyonensis TaxID=1173614 RepID=A0ABW3ZJ51_9RHOB
MRRLFLFAGLLSSVAAAAYGAVGILAPVEPTIIRIEVSADRLAECRETLAQVASMPVVADNGTPALFDISPDLPQVACVLEGS